MPSGGTCFDKVKILCISWPPLFELIKIDIIKLRVYPVEVAEAIDVRNNGRLGVEIESIVPV